MQATSLWGNLPGQQAATETYESEFRWGPAGQGQITGGTIYSGAADSGNSPTFELRRGLLLGQRTADGAWNVYAPSSTDGSEVACGVLLTGLRMQDVFSGVNTGKFWGILVGGPVKAATLLNLDNQARAAMAARFQFDDPPNLAGNQWFPWKRFQTKTANYQVTVGDNFTVFDNTGAGAEVDFTLPPIQNGLSFGFRDVVNFILKVISSEGGNIIALNNATASSVAFSTASQMIGGMFRVYSNQLGTKWIVENSSAGAAAVTVA